MVENVTDISKFAEVRSFHFATGGDNDNNGRTYNLAFATPEKSIEQCNALIPAPGIGTAAAAISFGAGVYQVEIDDLDFILFIASGVNLLNKPGVLVTVKLGIVASLECNSVQSDEFDGIAVLCDGKARTGLDCKFITASGGGQSFCLRVTGFVDDLFVNVNQIVVVSNIGIFDDSANLNPISYDIREITQLDGTTAIKISAGRKTLNIGSIVPSVLLRTDTTTTALHATNGAIIDAEITVMAAVTVLKVDADSEINLISATVSGGIVVAEDGLLNCNIANFIGTVSPSDPGDGRVNGTLGGVRYGNARVLDEIVLSAFSEDDQDPTGLGAPLQIEFGDEQINPIASIDDEGTITVHKIAQYKLHIRLNVGRKISAGGVALIFFMFTVDGVQVGGTVPVKLDGINDDIPINISSDALNLEPDQEIKGFMLRSVDGMNDGSLVSKDPNQTGWDITRSASITIVITR